LPLFLVAEAPTGTLSLFNFQEFWDRRLFNFYGISTRNTSKVHMTHSLLRGMRGWKNHIEKPRIGGTNYEKLHNKAQVDKNNRYYIQAD